MKGLILAGGKGTRLYPTTRVVNKHLLLIYDKPMIAYPIETLREAGITDIIISLSYDQPQQFMRLLGDGKELGVNLSYVIHGEPKGIAHSIYHAQSWLEGEPFVCHLGDNIFDESLRPYVERFMAEPRTSLMLFKKMGSEAVRRYGTAIFDGKGEVVRFIEKPEFAPNPYAMLGVYFLSPKFFKVCPSLKPSERGEYEITDAVNLLLPDVECAFYDGVWWDCGMFDDILEASKYMNKKKGEQK